MKRALDLVGAFAVLIVTSPLLGVSALAIAIEDRGPVLFRQRRVGLAGRDFEILKLRTMVVGAEQRGAGLAVNRGDERITRVGRVLRRLSLDELPQLWNVVRGEMSLVGPRAERPELVASFQKQVPFYRARLLVKPGVSGWAQINYGYYASVTEMAVKLEYDLYYIKHRTLAMDLQIILRTIGTMLRRTGR